MFNLRFPHGIRRLFGSCSLRSKILVFQGFFAFLAKFLWPSVAPMLARCMAECGVAFRVALPKSSRFSSHASRQNIGVWHVPVCPRYTPIEGVGFELSVRSPEARGRYLSVDPLIDRLAHADIIQLRVEASLRDKRRWCGLQCLGCPSNYKFWHLGH